MELHGQTPNSINSGSYLIHDPEFVYDKVGNRLLQTENVGETITTTVYVYDGNDRLLREVVDNQVAVSYDYDANGNTIRKQDGNGSTVYTWNDEGRLVGAIALDGNGNPQQQMEYRYNQSGIRVVSSVDGEETYYLIDDSPAYAQVLEEYNDAGLQVSYTYGNDLINQTRDNLNTFYMVDGLGSTRLLTDIQGNVLNAYDYDAFGETIHQSGNADNQYLFTGEQFDQGLGDYYLRDRFYDESIGRFTRKDVYEGRIGEPLTLHKYLYANGNPAYYTDPSGKFSLAQNVAISVISGILASLVYPSPVLTATSSGDTDPYNPILERFFVELIAGGLLVGIAKSAFGATTTVADSGILSSDDVFQIVMQQRNLGIPAEEVAGFAIDGTKQLAGNTLQRNILWISKDRPLRNFKDFTNLLQKFEEEALQLGASQVRILGYTVVNPRLGSVLSNPKFAERYGLIIRQVNPEVVEITKKL
jgi:RHS repeat-associated protein